MVKQLRKTIYVTDKRVQHEEKQLYAYCKMSKDVNRVNRCMSPRQLGIYRLRRFYMSTTLYVHCERSTVKKFEDVVMDDIEKRIGKMESTYFYSLLAPVNRQNPSKGAKKRANWFSNGVPTTLRIHLFELRPPIASCLRNSIQQRRVGDKKKRDRFRDFAKRATSSQEIAGLRVDCDKKLLGLRERCFQQKSSVAFSKCNDALQD